MMLEMQVQSQSTWEADCLGRLETNTRLHYSQPQELQ